MSWWSAGEPGDWVRATASIPVTVSDRLTGQGGLPAGTLGVVLDRYGSRLRVEFDAGWGTATATVNGRSVRVVRRAGGTSAFRTRTRRLTLARLAVAVALALPVLQFVAAYIWAYRTFNGIVPAFVEGAVYGAQDSFLAALHQPRQAIIYFGVIALLSRFAFGRRAR